jgi:hypothetical protein
MNGGRHVDAEMDIAADQVADDLAGAANGIWVIVPVAV